MTSEEQDVFDAEIKALVGAPMSRPGSSANPVNIPMIQRWADAFCDHNPLYEDKDAAAETRHGDIFAPPAMMPVWSMARPKLDADSVRNGYTTEIDPSSPLLVFDKAGYFGNLMTNSEMEFERQLRIGDSVNAESHVESISERKKTGLGYGYFVTFVTTFSDQHDEIVGRLRSTIFKFDPSTMGAA